MSTITSGTNVTFESEVVLYNYNLKALAYGWNVNYAYITNQPRAYRDTLFADTDEKSFTIGCSNATLLTYGTTYYWYAYGLKSGHVGDKAKVSVQRGHRDPEDLYESTWSVFADATVTKVPFSNWNTYYVGSATY